MASSREYLEFIMEQLSKLEGVSHRAMMGEYVIYLRGKVVGGIYDDRLLVKPTKAAERLMPNAGYELPYEGGKPMLLVDNVDSREFLAELFEAVYADLPEKKTREGKRKVKNDNKKTDMIVKPFTENEIDDVLDFEKRLREEEDVWGWEIDDAYIESVRASFHDGRFMNSISLLAYIDGSVAGRIDAVLIPSHFDGSVKAYLDWICVLKSRRHAGVAQALLGELRRILKEKGVDTLIALTAANEEAQRFYKSVPDSIMRDVGIWIDIK